MRAGIWIIKSCQGIGIEGNPTGQDRHAAKSQDLKLFVTSGASSTSSPAPDTISTNNSSPYNAPDKQPIQSFKMKPVVGVMQAWSCIVISVFAIIILSVIGTLFKANHHSMMGSKDDPEDGAAVAGTVFSAVIVYAVFLVGCSFQAWLHLRENRRGTIALS